MGRYTHPAYSTENPVIQWTGDTHMPTDGTQHTRPQMGRNTHAHRWDATHTPTDGTQHTRPQMGRNTYAHRWDATHTPRTALETGQRLTQWTGDTHTPTAGTRHTPLYSTGPGKEFNTVDRGHTHAHRWDVTHIPRTTPKPRL